MAATMEAILGAVYLNSNLMMFGEVMQTSGLVLLASQDAENQWTIKHIALTDSESRPRDIVIATSLKLKQFAASLCYFDATASKLLYGPDTYTLSDLDVGR